MIGFFRSGKSQPGAIPRRQSAVRTRCRTESCRVNQVPGAEECNDDWRVWAWRGCPSEGGACDGGNSTVRTPKHPISSQIQSSNNQPKSAQFTGKISSNQKSASSPYYPLTRSHKGQKVGFFPRKWCIKTPILRGKTTSVKKVNSSGQKWGLRKLSKNRALLDIL